jgi:bla regulator protein blaR1
MANWSQSHFLQSIGWAILNSIWQMALLWCIFIAASYIFNLNSRRKYQWATASLFTGFGWFLAGFFYFLSSAQVLEESFFGSGLKGSLDLVEKLLLSASVTYLLFLVFPAVKLFRNWRFVQKIRVNGLHKAELHYRLFVKDLSSRLGIEKKVSLFISDIIHSPVTIGYLKPVILLPIAALNQLSVAQVEAILLHELAHIRRYDYLLNLFINLIGTLLYFNPFVKLFLNAVEEERENCCDELVLQFQYDTASYASALVTLQRSAVKPVTLAIAATGKNPLLKRIEKMAGMENNNFFSFRKLTGILAALLFIVGFNSIIIIRNNDLKQEHIAFSSMTSPFILMPGEMEMQMIEKDPLPLNIQTENFSIQTKGEQLFIPYLTQGDNDMASSAVENNPYVFQAGTDEVDNSLSNEQKDQVNSTVKATKKILQNLQWKEIETEIGEVMTAGEKAVAKQEFSDEIEKINWENIEKNLKAQYEKLDWERINENLSSAISQIELDKIYTNYNSILIQLEKTENEILKRSSVTENPLPDASVSELRRMKEEVKSRISIIQSYRERKIIRL